MLVGWEAPNVVEIPEQFWTDFMASGAGMLKTRLYHGLAVYQRATQINPRCRFLLRPSDEGRLNAREQFVKARPVIASLRERGIDFWFQTWNEPDHTDRRYGGPSSREGAQEFAQELHYFLRLLNQGFWDLKTVSPPLAVTAEQSVFDAECSYVFGLHDYIGEHLYWQGDNHLSPDWGLRILGRRSLYPNRPFVVSEIGDSSNDGRVEAEWVPASRRYDRITACLHVLATLGYVEAAAIFIGRGSTEHWRGWWPDDGAVSTTIPSNGGSMPVDQYEAIFRDMWQRQGVNLNPDDAFFRFAIQKAKNDGVYIIPQPSKDGNYYTEVNGYLVAYTFPPVYCSKTDYVVKVGLPPF